MLAKSLNKLILGFSSLGKDPVHLRKLTDTIQLAVNNGINKIDCAPFYGKGSHENVLGVILQALNKKPQIYTKVGSVIDPNAFCDKNNGYVNSTNFSQYYDYTAAGILKSFEQSILRLGQGSCNTLMIQNLDPITHGKNYQFHFKNFFDSGRHALEQLKNEHKVEKIGFATRDARTCENFLLQGSFYFDEIMLSGNYNLTNQAALAGVIPICKRYHIPLLISEPFGNLFFSDKYNNNFFGNNLNDGDKAKKVEAIKKLCNKHGVSLHHAALQFVYANPYVTGMVVDAKMPEDLKFIIRDVIYPINPEFWQDMAEQELIPYDCLSLGLEKNALILAPKNELMPVNGC